jgi:transketolase
MRHAPVALALTRQAVPTLDRSRYAPASGLARGGYILADCEGVPEVILMATGSEVQLVVGAYEELTASGVRARVVSMPCCELFDRQPAGYRDEVLIPSVTARVAVEQASTLGWDRYVGADGTVIGMRTFGASAPLKTLAAEFGFTTDAVVRAARECIAAVAAKGG